MCHVFWRCLCIYVLKSKYHIVMLLKAAISVIIFTNVFHITVPLRNNNWYCGDRVANIKTKLKSIWKLIKEHIDICLPLYVHKVSWKYKINKWNKKSNVTTFCRISNHFKRCQLWNHIWLTCNDFIFKNKRKKTPILFFFTIYVCTMDYYLNFSFNVKNNSTTITVILCSYYLV